MNKFFDSVRGFFSHIHLPKRKPAKVQAEKSSQPAPAKKVDRFTWISWGVTLVLVAGLLGGALWWTQSTGRAAPLPAAPTAAPSEAESTTVGLPSATFSDGGLNVITRNMALKTIIPERPRSEMVEYQVVSGDAMAAISKKFNIKSESILYCNKDELQDNPHNLRPGMRLIIPPVDGLYYTWKDGDTIDSIATKFDAKAEDILSFSGNKLDLTNPTVKPGTLVMIPGGSRELRDWSADLTTMARGSNTGTGGANATNSCGGGAVGDGVFGWPANNHSISGNPYGPGHLGIDISANQGDPVYAADDGVVTMAQGGWNYGYGNVVQIDHGNGYVTVYAHLSQINVGVCESVGQGSMIGLAGNTGNSFGAHLHFEIRVGGKNIDPTSMVQ